MPLTSEERVYDRLREQIFSGAFPTGEFLSQRMLASRTDASVVTVRAVLRRLENEGLIENVPRWGVRIPIDTAEDVKDRYFMRETLEVAAVRKIAGKLVREKARQLTELAKACDGIRGTDEEAIREFAEVHTKFHLQIARCAGSKLLEAFLKRLNLRSMMLMNANRGWARGRDRGGSYHQDLVKVIVSGDATRAIREMRRHIQRGLKNELEALSEYEAAHDSV